MKKEDIEILEYKTVENDKEMDKIISLHQDIFVDSPLKNKLIYFVPNFRVYLKEIIEDSKHDFVFIAKLNNSIEAFIHFKLLNDTVFLNNICVSGNLQGSGVGKMLLKYGLDLLNQETFSFFSLDVFLSNSKALKWYEKLGLNVQSSREWKEITSRYNEEIRSKEVDFQKDLNGFESVFFKNDKVGTIVNDTLLLSNTENIEKLPLGSFKSVITNQDLPSYVEYELIATSLRMYMNLNDLWKGLKNEV